MTVSSFLEVKVVIWKLKSARGKDKRIDVFLLGKSFGTLNDSYVKAVDGTRFSTTYWLVHVDALAS